MADEIPHPLTPQDCLVAVMIAVSASDENILTAELVKIEGQINHLPVFGDYDTDRLNSMSQMVFDLFAEEDGLDALFGLLRDNLPETLHDTAYALAGRLEQILQDIERVIQRMGQLLSKARQTGDDY